jgi:hypothetical protein
MPRLLGLPAPTMTDPQVGEGFHVLPIGDSTSSSTMAAPLPPSRGCALNHLFARHCAVALMVDLRRCGPPSGPPNTQILAEPSILWAKQRYRGRLLRLGEMSDDDAQSLHRGSGGSTYTRKAHATREAPKRGRVRDDRTNWTPVRDRPGALGWRRGS